MKLLLAIVALVVIAATVFADYKWRKWMAARRNDRNQGSPRLAASAFSPSVP